MTNEQFKFWRERMNLSRADLAEIFDVTINTIGAWENGYRLSGTHGRKDAAVPKSVQLACAAIQLGVREYDGAGPIVIQP
jgi:transcriptional regulator with XRE-family HTH domain